MPEEYVAAQHDFTPEHEDEIEFKVGELILVIEKDDQYGDGWWQGRNSAGKTGLFPKSYTKVYDPSSIPEINIPTFLDPLTEEEENPAAGPSANPETVIPPHQPVMQSTISDVQKAIEQLAVRRDTDTDAGRSFSFVSTNGADTEPETEEEGENHHNHGDFRRTLAERAEKFNQRIAAEQPDPSTLDPVGSAIGFLRRRSSSNVVVVPPIAVELSDESDADDEDEDEEAVKKRHEHDVHPHHHKYRSSTSKLDETPTGTRTGTPRQSTSTLTSPPEVTIVEPPSFAAPRPLTPVTATVSDFPSIPQLIHAQSHFFSKPAQTSELAASLPSSNGIPAAPSPAQVMSPTNIPLPKSPSPAIIADANGNGINLTQVQDSYNRAPLTQVPRVPHTEPARTPPITEHASISSPPVSTPAPEVPVVTASTQSSTVPATQPSTLSPDTDPLMALKRTHPSEWTIDQVILWLKSKNVDETTCAKFTEHEITGDVLLELDVNILKEEMGIAALGKRMRIANAIVELKRPASFSSEPLTSPPATLSQASSGYGPPAMVPVFGNVHVQNGYVGHPFAGNTDQYAHTYPNVVNSTMNGRRMMSDEGSASVASTGDDSLKVPKTRPAYLALSSPSESALNTKIPTQETEDGAQEVSNTLIEDRGVQSENETPATSSTAPSRRRRFLGLSTESSSSRGSKDRKSSEITSIPNSPALRDKDDKASPSLRGSAIIEDGTNTGKHIKGKKSLDSGTTGTPASTERITHKSSAGDRLSFFGATLGKSRKPPPRYSVYEDTNSNTTAPPPEKSSRSISRFMTGGKKNPRPGTAPGGSMVPFGSKDDTHVSLRDTKDPTLLRKRHISTVGPISPPIPNAPKVQSPNGKVKVEVGEPQFRPGQSVLDQIGIPDHAGWLRKKGERYNTWKLRYLVLKGSHLYYLKSNSPTETKIKGYISVHGYKVVVDENLNPGKYGFRLVHETLPGHFFSSEEQLGIRNWMKALMKATIDRDYSTPVVSSCNIPTIPLTVAQTMNPAPRPPSPSARDATQRALRRENPNQLSSRDARVLMGLPGTGVEYGRGEPGRADFFTYNVENVSGGFNGSTPPRPSRTSRAPSVNEGSMGTAKGQHMRAGSADRMDAASEMELVQWANTILPEHYRIWEITKDLTSGLVLLRLAENIKGSPSEPPVPDSLFKDENNIEGMFKLFDFLLDNDVKVGSVSINDIKQGGLDKTMQLLKALRSWHDKRNAIVKSIGKGAGAAGPWMAMETGSAHG